MSDRCWSCCDSTGPRYCSPGFHIYCGLDHCYQMILEPMATAPPPAILNLGLHLPEGHRIDSVLSRLVLPLRAGLRPESLLLQRLKRDFCLALCIVQEQRELIAVLNRRAVRTGPIGSLLKNPATSAKMGELPS